MSQLEDRAQIEDLHQLFAHGADRRDFALMRSLYTDDATEDHFDYQGHVDGYIEWARAMLDRFEQTFHFFARPLVVFNGADAAESITYCLNYTRTPGPEARTSVSMCRYFDRYRRTSQGWRFSHRTLCGDMAQPLPAGAPSVPFFPGMVCGLNGPEDPFSHHLPGVAAAVEAMARKR